VEPEHTGASLHARLMSTIVRAAEAEENSHLAIHTCAAEIARLRTTIAEGHAARARRARGSTFAFGHVDDRDRSRSG
jgi:hypothetical protein